jgi:hydrogenase maturation protease
MSTSVDHILFVGIGSPHGDDQVGWSIADALAELLPGVATRKASVPADLLDWLERVDLLGVCDACRGGGPAGTVQRFEWERSTGPARSSILASMERVRVSGTHGLGLSAVLDLAQRLGRLPDRILVWGIEGQAFELGEELSPRVKDLLPAITAAIRSELFHA